MDLGTDRPLSFTRWSRGTAALWYRPILWTVGPLPLSLPGGGILVLTVCLSLDPGLSSMKSTGMRLVPADAWD